VTGFVGIGLFYDPNVLVSGNQVTVALSGTATSTNSFAVALAEPVGTGGVSGSNTFTPTAIVVNTIASGSLAYVLEKTTCVGDGTESFAPTFTNTYSNSTIYVDANVASGGADDGTSWANAYTSVFTAISTANADASSTNRVAILVAEGTYYPNSTNTASVATSSTFTLYNDVSIIGGYPTGGDRSFRRQHCLSRRDGHQCRFIGASGKLHHTRWQRRWQQRDGWRWRRIVFRDRQPDDGELHCDRL
jgi:hypothetical protein